MAKRSSSKRERKKDEEEKRNAINATTCYATLHARRGARLPSVRSHFSFSIFEFNANEEKETQFLASVFFPCAFHQWNSIYNSIRSLALTPPTFVPKTHTRKEINFPFRVRLGHRFDDRENREMFYECFELVRFNAIGNILKCFICWA